MNKKLIYVGALAMLFIAGAYLLWSLREKPMRPVPEYQNVTSSLVVTTPKAEIKVTPPPRTTNKDELHAWWLEMSKLDKNFEWKMPIEFYGKVIDDRNLPVEDADINFQWTDLSKEGTSEYKTSSDSQGLFKLFGVKGKNLGVQVRKGGYKHYYIGTQFSFEYAAYFEKTFHVPDPDNPVIFRLRKNKEAEPLVKREVRLHVSIGKPATFALNPTDPNAAKIVIDLQTNAQLRDKQWSARISVPSGGLKSTLEEFPYEAPESGYEPSVMSEYDTPKPVGVDGGYQGGVFYVKAPKGYGRVEIKMMPGNNFARITSFWNPSGSRNLEFDPAKAIKPTP
jgi:hypothetical protein